MDGLGSVGRSAPGSYGPEAGSIVEASDLAVFFVVGWVSFGRPFFVVVGLKTQWCWMGRSVFFYRGIFNSGHKGHSKPFLFSFSTADTVK